jgi:ATP-binding cassette subfamily B (MDR/TAP) protein 7
MTYTQLLGSAGLCRSHFAAQQGRYAVQCNSRSASIRHSLLPANIFGVSACSQRNKLFFSSFSTSTTTPPPPVKGKGGKKDAAAFDAQPVPAIEIFKTFGRYLWPAGQPTIKARIVVALGLLIGAKLCNVQVPFLFKQAIDVLSVAHAEILVVPLGLLLMYGAARAGAALFQELRNAVFSRVTHRAVRLAACRAFGHMHSLDLSFHLSRQTGALNRIIDRGTRGINFVMGAMVFNVVPTIIEIGLVCGIMQYYCGPAYVAVTLGTLASYGVFTFKTTQWRTRYRKEMNALENEAANRAVDSLLNYDEKEYSL